MRLPGVVNGHFSFAGCLGPGKAVWAIAFAFVLLFVSGARCDDRYDVIVVQSIPFKTYDEVIEGFKRTCNCNVKKVIMAEGAGESSMDEIYGLKPKLIFAVGAKALKYLGPVNDLPLIYSMVQNPKPFTQSKKNLAGVIMDVPFDKQLSLVSKVFTSLKRLGVMYNPNEFSGASGMRNVINRADSLGITITEAKFHDRKDVVAAVDKMNGNVDALWITPSAVTSSPEFLEYIMLYSIRYKLPVLSYLSRHLDLGACVVIEEDPNDVGNQAGELANLVFHSGLQADNPYSESKFANVIINKVVASKLSLTVSEKFKNRDPIRFDLLKNN